MISLRPGARLRPVRNANTTAAWSGSAGYHVPSAYACGGGAPDVAVEPCGIIRTRELRWRRLNPERAR